MELSNASKSMELSNASKSMELSNAGLAHKEASPIDRDIDISTERDAKLGTQLGAKLGVKLGAELGAELGVKVGVKLDTKEANNTALKEPMRPDIQDENTTNFDNDVPDGGHVKGNGQLSKPTDNDSGSSNSSDNDSSVTIAAENRDSNVAIVAGNSDKGAVPKGEKKSNDGDGDSNNGDDNNRGKEHLATCSGCSCNLIDYPPPFADAPKHG